jgi:hypothetical protein
VTVDRLLSDIAWATAEPHLKEYFRYRMRFPWPWNVWRARRALARFDRCLRMSL